jgi:hypothetical protein
LQWLDIMLSSTAAAQFMAAALSCRRLYGYSRTARSPARRAAVSSLLLVCAALGLEAGLFLAQPPVLGALPRLALTIVVRALLLASSLAIGALLWRAPALRR